MEERPIIFTCDKPRRLFIANVLQGVESLRIFLPKIDPIRQRERESDAVMGLVDFQCVIVVPNVFLQRFLKFSLSGKLLCLLQRLISFVLSARATYKR